MRNFRNIHFKQKVYLFKCLQSLIATLLVGFVISCTSSGTSDNSASFATSASDYISQSKTLSEEGDYQGAIALLSKAIKLDPSNVEALTLRGTAYEALRKHTEAITDFSAAILEYPESADLYHIRGVAYQAKGLVGLAVDDFNKSSTLTGQADRHDADGQNLITNGDYASAITEFDKAIVIRPGYASYYVHRAKAYRLQGKNDNGIADSTRAIELDSTNTEAYIERGDAYMAGSSYDLALADFNTACDLSPNNADAFASRGDLFVKTKQYDQALVDYNSAVTLEPGVSGRYDKRGQVYLLLTQYDNAIADFTHALELRPSLIQAYFDRASVYILLGKTDEALADLLESIDYYQTVEAYYLIGVLLNNKGDFSDAISNYSKGIGVYNADPLMIEKCYYGRAIANMRSGHLNEAKSDFNKVISMGLDKELSALASQAIAKLGITY